MKEKNIYLLKNLILFFLASFLPKTISFFLVPLYTNCLSTTEYGTADLLINTVSLCVPILTLVVQDAVMKYTLDNQHDKKIVFTVGIKITCIGFLILSIGCTLLKTIGILKLDYFYILFLVSNYLVSALVEMISYFCRGINQIVILTVSSVAQTMTTIVSNLLFLLVLKSGLKGYLFSILLGYCVNILIVFFGAGLHKYIDFRHRDKKLEKEMFMFSAPLIASSLSWWINNASDKYILTYMCGLSVVGIYSVAYKIPTILSVLGTVISKAFTISAIKEIDTDDTDGFLGKSYSLISYVMTVGCAVLILLNPFLSKLLFAKDFYIAWKFVPPLLIAFLMSAISGTCQSILTAINKTTIISFTAILGAFVNVILNIILIPLYEGYGAAVATMFSFFVCWVGRYLELKRYVKFKNKISKEIIAYSLVSIEMILAYEENKYIWMESLIVVLIIVLYHKEEIYFIKNIFTKKKYVMEKKK